MAHRPSVFLHLKKAGIDVLLMRQKVLPKYSARSSAMSCSHISPGNILIHRDDRRVLQRKSHGALSMTNSRSSYTRCHFTQQGTEPRAVFIFLIDEIPRLLAQGFAGSAAGDHPQGRAAHQLLIKNRLLQKYRPCR